MTTSDVYNLAFESDKINSNSVKGIETFAVNTELHGFYNKATDDCYEYAKDTNSYTDGLAENEDSYDCFNAVKVDVNLKNVYDTFQNQTEANFEDNGYDSSLAITAPVSTDNVYNILSVDTETEYNVVSGMPEASSPNETETYT